MQATRQQILDYLREHGEANVRALGEHLELTATGVRQHLMILEREGLIASREVRGRIGRPALTFRLTEQGEALYPKAYDRLAMAVITTARERLPREDFDALMREAARALAEPHAARVAHGVPTERVHSLCEVLREQDVVVESQRTIGGFMVEHRTCPFHDVVESSTAACDLDAAFLGALTNLDVDLVSSRARGDATCKFMVHTTPAAERAHSRGPDAPGRG